MVSLGPPRLDMPPPVRQESTPLSGLTADARLSTASATGNPRNKVALAPGRSLLDWVRLGKGNVDLSGVGGRPRDVTAEELAKHCTIDDAWTALKGNVYNITPYMEYHPGGESELMRAAGIDCTLLFDEVHRWVNYETMLAKCYIGKFIPATDTPISSRRDTKLNMGSINGSQKLAAPPTFPTDGILKNISNADVTDYVKSSPFVPRYDWFQSDSSITLVIYTKCKRVNKESVMVQLQDHRNLSVQVFVDDNTFHVRRNLEDGVSTHFSVSADAKGKVDIVFTKNNLDKRWSTLGRRLDDDGAWLKTSTESINFWPCSVDSVQAVTHDTNLYCFRLPPGTHMVVPVGRHVFVTACIDGTDVVHSYTVVPPSLLGDHLAEDQVQEGHLICLMVKIYPHGLMTPLIGQLQLGSLLNISSTYAGEFDVQRLASVHRCVLFAAGSGFTPMSAIIRHLRCRSSLSAKCKVHLVFFNKTERDILWKDQLDHLASTVDWFRVDYVLSAADTKWNGLTGHLCKELLERYVPAPQSDDESILVCACGPTLFTQLAIRLAKEFGLSDGEIHAFLG